MASDSRGSRINWWILIGPFLGIGLIVWFFMGRSTAPVENPAGDGFSVDRVDDKDEPKPVTPYVSDFEKQRDAWMKDKGPGLTGFRQETQLKYGAEGDAKAAKAGDKKGPSFDELAHEKAFLSKNMGVIQAQRSKFWGVCQHYYKEQPIVREVNQYFGRKNMPRFMALYDQARKDGNIYKYWREAVALPEVRAGIKKYLTNPEALKVGLMMLAETMSTKPPKPLYDETFRFMAADDKVSEYMSKEFWPTALPRLPSALVGAPIPEAAKGNISQLANSLSNPLAGAPDISGISRPDDKK